MKRLMVPVVCLFLLLIVLIFYQKGFIGGQKNTMRTLEATSAEWDVNGNTVTIRLKDKNGEAVTSLGEVDNKKLHVAAANQDFSFFYLNNVTYSGKGIFKVTIPFKKQEPHAFILYLHDEEKAYKIDNYKMDGWKEGTIKKDIAMTRDIDGLQVSLASDVLFEHSSVTLTFMFQEKGKKETKTKFHPLKEDEGMVYLVDAEMETIALAHPNEKTDESPELSFDVPLPNGGMYLLYSVFEWDGKEHELPYGVEVIKKKKE
ncbi:hypothetical protein [Priestia taiwanensis]|uniref:Uncharacterized protein n=1 Tax=Priestia taiwanensis TaxID=1347902 RepID=A0A917EP70_9BACI|nr:hypothetical protein [Priestia taiwanensis]MBM7363912.1 hypothetical protein [Priestia taiwanensis]GGE70054.1 hypothetical protein GCM10007140_20030 [Priestia taiwanensis]